ncbi:hypothetical protein BJ508DRAFT_319022 [Ascobolus immersus RN42]|uniref:Glycosyl transferase CAP10 domain-containing protein n=1 Tax=Ascobolus immersus RN42 TaxID=1160509 RepID=A0A3N4HWD8_ASCIM|nr:hypothetical protein BJ508DRAFT_319022 [Ascobolus immersus RN42]
MSDGHPIAKLIRKAEALQYLEDERRSKTLEEAVKRYKEKWGRLPPPGFDKWYKYAKDKGVWNVDTHFDQINHDLRPFWSIPPADLRRLVRGLLEEDAKQTGLAGFHIRKGVVSLSSQTEKAKNFRTDLFSKMLKTVTKNMPDLPDLDFVMNRLDQPRVLVPFEDLQVALEKEESLRGFPKTAKNSFSKDFTAPEPTEKDVGEWFGYAGKQYMDIAAPACPPESYARNPDDDFKKMEALKSYTLVDKAGLVTNFNLSSDLCTVGPFIKDKHGFLFSSSTTKATKKLVPVFGESKVNVNNEILFPANMYYSDDKRYVYDPSQDVFWSRKKPLMLWRGVTADGTQVQDSWRRLHRHRLVLMTNSSMLAEEKKTYPVLIPQTQKQEIAPTEVEAENETLERTVTKYTPTNFHPQSYAHNFTDVGFSGILWCVPDPKCGFVKEVISEVRTTTLTEQFTSKFLIDVDGHSFSGRWRAFLLSRSLGIKATIFREWHDSRLKEWLHFFPLSNDFDELYALLTYLTGVPADVTIDGEEKLGQMIKAHDTVAEKIADNSRVWAKKVLRREDIDVYMYRLILEYARLMDDNRQTDEDGFAVGFDIEEEVPKVIKSN